MRLSVTGADVEVDDRHAQTPLLWVLRDVLGMHGTKFGCGAGFCAACTVLIDGRNTKSCQTATERAVGSEITTVEGASGEVVDAVRSAWHRGNVVQCGYCQPGQTLAAVALLTSKSAPDDATIDDWMSGNLCRCGTYPRIRAAIHEAAGTLAAGTDPGPLTAAAEVEVERGVLRHPSGKQATFAELAARAERLLVPDGVRPKERAQYRQIGREGRLRVDTAAKILGATRFTIDVNLPGMVTAVVL